ASMAFLRGKCLGGGSVVNQCLLDKFDDVAWDSWRHASGIDFFTDKAMEPHYEAIEGKLSMRKMSKENWNRNAQLYVQGFENLGLKWAPLRRGETDCAIDRGNDCIICLGGCPRDSKQSIPLVFLPDAVKQGLEIQSETEVERIALDGSKVRILASKAGKAVEYSGANCILAAGSLGSTRLMLRSGFKKTLPAIGEGFYCHPQIMNFALFDQPIDAHKGAFQTVKSDDSTLRKQGFKLENVFAQPIGVAMLYPGYGKKHQEWMKKYRYMACMEIAVCDVGRGKIEVDKYGRLRLKKKLSKEDWARARAGMKLVRQIFESVGAKEVVHSPFTFGLHLMGGNAMGVNPASSVVNQRFEVHGHPNILIADSSIFPAAPGINPALTIMALAHKASQIALES
ncbi:MAG TPA: GMC family oxidoreductase, partial [Candidatus Hodarchaeales archaeon]|nr:GMC family oxidoreductase [Candidatus Hodarchaeales archaeon]